MDHISQSIESLVTKIKELDAEAQKYKTGVNALRAIQGLPPLYAATAADSPAISLGHLKGHEFYGKSLSGVVRTILESRQASDEGPATVNEIYTAMIAGGYAFETADEDNAKRGLRISLTKNSQTFHKLPNGKYGLREWFPNLKDKPKVVSAAVRLDAEHEPEESEEEPVGAPKPR